VLTTNTAAELFRHLSAEKTVLYRSIMDVFAAAKRQYRLQLRPDEVLAEADWSGSPPRLEEVSSALVQLAEWGNLESQPDTARVSSLNDFYRARFLYRLSHAGEAVEAGLTVFFQTLYRRAELQTVALEDITSRLLALRQLVDDTTSPDGPDVAKMHEVLRDLVRVFEDLAENAQAFMAGVARSLELQQSDANAVVTYKRRLIDYLERFMGDLVRALRSHRPAHSISLLPHRSHLSADCRARGYRRGAGWYPRPDGRKNASLAGLARAMERTSRLVPVNGFGATSGGTAARPGTSCDPPAVGCHRGHERAAQRAQRPFVGLSDAGPVVCSL
jgi:uncharacterized protein (TIGR02677 family)